MDEKITNEGKKPLPDQDIPLGNFFGRIFLNGKKDRKLLFKLAGIIVVGVFLMTFANSWGKTSGGQPAAAAVGEGGYYANEKALEERLAGILSGISGAGEVRVAVSFASGKESEYAYNSDSSKRVSTSSGGDTAGADSDMENSESLTLATDNNNPVVVKEYMPVITGVLVVATGARDSQVKRRIFEAVEGLLALPAHRIVISY